MDFTGGQFTYYVESPTLSDFERAFANLRRISKLSGGPDDRPVKVHWDNESNELTIEF